jgi:hypothetical protein
MATPSTEIQPGILTTDSEKRDFTRCGRTIPSCHPEQQRRIWIWILKQIPILPCRAQDRLLAPQNDSADDFFPGLVSPAFQLIPPNVPALLWFANTPAARKTNNILTAIPPSFCHRVW